MPALGPLLAWFAGYLISSLIFRFFAVTGLSIVSFAFLNDQLGQARTALQNSFYGLPADVLAFIQLWKIDQAISIVLSALTIAAYIKTAKVFIGRSS